MAMAVVVVVIVAGHADHACVVGEAEGGDRRQVASCPCCRPGACDCQARGNFAVDVAMAEAMANGACSGDQRSAAYWKHLRRGGFP